MSFGKEYNYSAGYASVAESAASERATFIRRTYTHVAGAILGFVAIQALIFFGAPSVAEQIARAMLSGSWLLVLLAFMAVSFIANRWAMSDVSRGVQYAGLILYVVAEAFIFVPLLWIANYIATARGVSAGGMIAQAGILTLMVFGGLTLAAFTTRKDFSFLGPIVCVGSFIALGVIIAGSLFGFNLGLFFCFAMVALLSAMILYQTSAIMYHYRTDQYVAAALGLFSSIATLFWYILQIFMSSRD
jgi:FtsH-binding integral membrane protein